MKKGIATIAILIGTLILFSSALSIDSINSKPDTVFPKVKITPIKSLPEKKNTLDYVIDSLTGTIYCSANNPSNNRYENVTIGRDRSGLEDLVLYKYQNDTWTIVDKSYKEYSNQKLFSMEGQIYWSVTTAKNSKSSKEISFDSKIFLVSDDGLKTIYSDIPGSVYGLIRFHNEVYVYGIFNTDRKDDCCGLMKWDNDHFEPIKCNKLSQNPSMSIAMFKDAAVFDDKLFFCGFINASLSDSSSADNFIAWDGSKWSSAFIRSSFSSTFQTLEVYENRLYLSGMFNSDSKKPININNIISFDKKGYPNDLRGGCRLRPDKEVGIVGLTPFQDKMVVTGSINFVLSNKKIKDIAFWDGKEFSPIIQQCTGPVTRFLGAVPYKNKLLVYGPFLTINNVKVRQHAWIEFEE